MVGVGMNAEEMTANNRLTERIVQNLNAKVSYLMDERPRARLQSICVLFDPLSFGCAPEPA